MYALIVLPLRMFEKVFLCACDDVREKDKPQNPVFFASHDQKCRGEVCLSGED